MNISMFDKIRGIGNVTYKKKVTKSNRKGRMWRVQTIITWVNNRPRVKQIIHYTPK